MTKTEIFEKRCEGYLNERYSFWKDLGENIADWHVYEGAIGALTSFGCDWTRDENGKHNVHFLNAEDAKRLDIHAYD